MELPLFYQDCKMTLDIVKGFIWINILYLFLIKYTA